MIAPTFYEAELNGNRNNNLLTFNVKLVLSYFVRSNLQAVVLFNVNGRIFHAENDKVIDSIPPPASYDGEGV